MSDYLFKGDKSKKWNILVLIILALAVRLFFSDLFIQNTEAKVILNDEEIVLAALDPWEKIGENSLEKLQGDKKLCENNFVVKRANVENDKLKKAHYWELIKGYPIEMMLAKISEKDEKVAAFIIGIAKKESNWGVYSPKKYGRDCYNYWGYRGGYNQTESGYSCFDNPEQAVDEIGGRIEKLISQNINTPERMIVWKCGHTCAGHDPQGVKKWISDVSLYYNKLNS